MVLSVKQIAALLGCSEQAVYKQVYRQAIPYRKMGRKVIFLRQEVEAYLLTRTRSSKTYRLKSAIDLGLVRQKL